MGETSGSSTAAVSSDAPLLAAVRRLRHRHIVDRLDYLRGLRRLAAEMTQAELARELGITQPSISSALRSAAKVADPPAGFCGAGVYEMPNASRQVNSAGTTWSINSAAGRTPESSKTCLLSTGIGRCRSWLRPCATDSWTSRPIRRWWTDGTDGLG